MDMFMFLLDMYCVYIFYGFLGNLCFKGLKPVHDVPKELCCLWNLEFRYVYFVGGKDIFRRR